LSKASNLEAFECIVLGNPLKVNNIDKIFYKRISDSDDIKQKARRDPINSDPINSDIKPDLILIYRKPDINTLQLVRLGSHSELGI
jgi:mRNA-degrading endonuclease YafQ of YafQ-DinJ toxin-antitoxin module